MSKFKSMDKLFRKILTDEELKEVSDIIDREEKEGSREIPDFNDEEYSDYIISETEYEKALALWTEEAADPEAISDPEAVYKLVTESILAKRRSRG